MSEMFAFDEEQELIARSALDLLDDRCGFEAVRKWMESEAGYDADLWRELAGLGWLGMIIPEEFGGSGMGVTELVSVVESMGRKVFGSPFLANTLAAELLVLAADDEQKRRWLPALAAGEMIGCVALGERSGSWDLGDLTARAEDDAGQLRLMGEKCFVLDAQNADLFLVACRHEGEPAIVVLERSEIPAAALCVERIVDETRRSARLRLDGLTIAPEALLVGAGATAALQHVQLLGALLVSAEMAGAAQGVMDLTVEYLKTRVQFGRKIGGYQALKHPMVWIMVGVEHSISLLYRAATLWDAGEDASQIEMAVRMSKAMSGDSCTNAVDRSIQFHGAFGFTWDCNAQLFFRRAQWAEYTFGDAAHHRRHLAGFLLGSSAQASEY
ncbi:MAG: acyl-CoA/acyl-ACP dehydrogenase [bacterium]|nr:acyl-CoA dehydrogenase [Deltaproteobacteria bacterium]MCP4903571.1 acyl-CoA/acyl-ACP dehydrogenase [bacterium]